MDTQTQNITFSGEELLSTIPNSLAVSSRDEAALWVAPGSIIFTQGCPIKFGN
jgi:hypothetical protein